MDPATNEDIDLSAPAESPPPVAGVDYDPNAPRSDLMDPEVRDRILNLLAAVGREWPTMRFGQLVCMVAGAADSAVPDSVYDVEDAEFLAAAEERLAYRRANR
jgi:hypothetical protein